MSRIAGIVGDYTPLEQERLLARMLQTFQGETSFQSWTELRTPTAFGLYGQSSDGLFVSPTVAVVVDGYLYNQDDFRDLTGEGDAALIAQLYLCHGLCTTLQKLNGDFALALYDFRDCTLYLARDRF